MNSVLINMGTEGVTNAITQKLPICHFSETCPDSTRTGIKARDRSWRAEQDRSPPNKERVSGSFLKHYSKS